MPMASSATTAAVNRSVLIGGTSSVVSARWLYCERRSGACGGRARSSLLRRSSGYASSVVAALARLGSRLDALATSHLADTTLASGAPPLNAHPKRAGPGRRQLAGRALRSNRSGGVLLSHTATVQYHRRWRA